MRGRDRDVEEKEKMKAVLVINEMPKCCDDCQLNYDMGFGCDGFALDDDTPIDMKEMRDETKRPS